MPLSLVSEISALLFVEVAPSVVEAAWPWVWSVSLPPLVYHHHGPHPFCLVRLAGHVADHHLMQAHPCGAPAAAAAAAAGLPGSVAAAAAAMHGIVAAAAMPGSVAAMPGVIVAAAAAEVSSARYETIAELAHVSAMQA